MCVSQYTCLIVCAQPIAVETCKILGLGHNILVGHEELEVSSVQEMMADRTLKDKYGARCMESNGFAGVHPEHKYLIVQTFRQMGHLVGMCGDGVNDAPALKKADVGIAVSGAKAAAQKASDIVLTEPGLNTIVKAMVISRKIFTRMQNFVIYRVACTEQVNTAVPLRLYLPSACSFILHPELLQSKQSNVTQRAILCLSAVALLLCVSNLCDWQLLFFFLISCLCYKPNEYMPSDWVANGGDASDWPDYFALPVLALVTVTRAPAAASRTNTEVAGFRLQS